MDAFDELLEEFKPPDPTEVKIGRKVGDVGLQPSVNISTKPLEDVWKYRVTRHYYTNTEGTTEYVYRLSPNAKYYMVCVATLQDQGEMPTARKLAALSGGSTNTIRRYLNWLSGVNKYNSMRTPSFTRGKLGREIYWMLNAP